ncbi:hypothetical protein [Turneriella parva]|uniref:Uncharacterized protein n=1 Tax=Turneriella parva (strain ATCC BAA-1111 / DSM 21527 / NCTC 11395 / H) TaxID=869212 RepID=I4B1W2_TURPD|nr:hypothetical protein [Turneriella parva]AFM11269.1 hypothetical protein Turpa_0617 [Turneriella parva DSM 21527]
MLHFLTAPAALRFYILMNLAVGCTSRQITEGQIESCLARTDTVSHDTSRRAAIAWLVAYDQKVKDTRCCALEPRPSLLAKRRDLKELNDELLNRIDALETGSDAARRAELSAGDKCYRALIDLYHDGLFAARSQR